MKTGIVEDVKYTNGGAGNQWTTIDGVRYATWWDMRTKDWDIGDTVSFETSSRPIWEGGGAVPQASDIHKIDPALTLAP